MLKIEKIENKRKIIILGFIKFTYHKKNVKNKHGFFGDYSSWDEVSKLCKGYSAENILQKTLDSVLKVKNGEAVFERDSWIFDKIQYSFPLLACLFKVAVNSNNNLKIVDFGGALGSHYFQNKEFLKPVNVEKWTVIEQLHYVKTGNEQIADEVLEFKNSVDEVEDANVFIASSVIQYLPNPYEFLEKFVNKNYPYMIFDRLQLNAENRDRLTLQVVPPEIYEAKYPSWFLDENKFLSYFEDKYDLITDFDDTIDVAENIPSRYKGYFFKRKGI